MVNSPGPLSSASRILGMDNLMLKLVTEPALVKTLLEKLTQFIISFTDALIEAGADIIFLPEPAGSTNLISPGMFREFVFPILKRQIEQIGRPTVLHICGKIIPIVRDMADTDAEILSIDQDVSIQKARELIDDNVALGGNIDPIEVLAKKTPEEISRISRMNCHEGGANFVLMPGCTITPDTPVENIRAMMNVAKEELDKSGTDN